MCKSSQLEGAGLSAVVTSWNSLMKDLVVEIARALVDNPEAVNVTEVEGEQKTILELSVDQSDIGKVIGRQGRTVRALRTLLSAAGVKLQKRFTLEILD